MSTELEKKRVTASEAFTLKVMAEFSGGVGEIALTNFQKRLVGNYFIATDSALKLAEEKRLKKKTEYQDAVPVTWENVNMQKLARDVVAMARVGFDPSQKNHINMMPFKNNNLQKYDIVFIEGYRGLELKASKYGLSVPDMVIVELVYSTDRFKSIKKDTRNKYESYEFEITNEFERGNIVGGFYYHIYSENPEKNRLVVMSLKEILKRKPDHAGVEFWGGEKDVWKNGKKTGDKETVDGWFDKMAWKTVSRAAYSDITIDSQKIDDDYLRLSQLETDADEARVTEEIRENANSEPIDVEFQFKDDQAPTPETTSQKEEAPASKLERELEAVPF